VNEDMMAWNSELAMAAVADGMGGHNAGEVAAHLALQAVEGFLRRSASGGHFTWPFGVDSTMSFAANRLVTAARLANRVVFRAADERVEYVGMGTTLVAALVAGTRLTFVNVGDSRLYIEDGSELRQLSRDDSWLVMISENEGLQRATTQNHPMQHVLTNAIGASAELEVTAQECDIAEGHTLLLCTDGLHDALTDDQIHKVVRCESDLDRCAQRLVDGALEHGGKDNITVVLVRHASGDAGISR
jgi:protein phosphatase